MAFKLPKYLKNYLNSTKYRKPFENFVNNATYYSKLDWQWMSYMNNVVRPCIAYSTASVDGVYNNLMSTSAGMAILRGAARLIAGDKHFFIGDDRSCRFLSDIWAPSVNFDRFLSRAIQFMCGGGTSVIKWNRDERGKNSLAAFRVDRTMFSTNEAGDVTSAVFFVSLLTSMEDKTQTTYWLTEERKYNDEGKPVILYKVFVRNGLVNAPTLPSPHQSGVAADQLPRNVLLELKRLGVPRLNVEIPLPTYEGLGVWLLARTATNSCIPDAPLGDPLLYGCLDVLWSIDVVFSGSIVDVLNGEGKILVPKNFLQDTLNRLQAQNPGMQFNVTTTELEGYSDESFVYVMPSGFDKEKQAPLAVQFEIRAEQYGKMMEMYERIATVRAGYSPTSIFPYLTPDSSAKTAREITAEENLTRASVRETHSVILPVLNRALREVLRQEGLNPNAQLQLSDYIGNKLEFDENIRQNYAAKLIPHEVAVQSISNLTVSETKEYLAKIEEDKRKEGAAQGGGALFNDKDYFGSDG